MAIGVESNLLVEGVSAHLLSFPNFIILHNIEIVSIINCGKFECVTSLTILSLVLVPGNNTDVPNSITCTIHESKPNQLCSEFDATVFSSDRDYKDIGNNTIIALNTIFQ